MNVDLHLFLGCFIRPRYWYQIPWRFVGFFDNAKARAMRDEIRKRGRP